LKKCALDTRARPIHPHWADPLKVWGDVLLKQGRSKDALAKYDEALKYAPNWKQLKEARESAATTIRPVPAEAV